MCEVPLEQNAPVAQHRERITQLRDTAFRGEPIPLKTPAPLPWQLSTRAKKIVNDRVVGIIYPHHTPTCSTGDDSFITRAGCWKASEQIQALLVILVVVLRGFVATFRTGLRYLVLGLRILEGQTVSVNRANFIGVDVGSSILSNDDIKRAKKLISEGLAMIEGCVAICLLVPAIHCLLHYADGAALWGLLRLLWMMSFERYNKKCKNLTSNKHRPFQSLATALVRDETARYHRWRKNKGVSGTPCKVAVKGRGSHYELSRDMRRQITLPCGCRAGCNTVTKHKTATICQRQFTAGQRLSPGKRCGSIVCVVSPGGKSSYGRVVNFIRILCGCPQIFDFALVTWFPRPRYPDGDPLTVRIDLDGIDVNNIRSVRVVSLKDIVPSRILVEMDQPHDCMYMMRKDGYDTVVDR